MLLKPVASFALGKGISLTIARGSVVDFAATGPAAVGAIVNAANKGCLGGGGVDGAINDAGGPNLWRDRKALPVIKGKGSRGVRCLTGDAVVTGPGDYDELRVPFVIHAVGPDYSQYEHLQESEEDFAVPDELLCSAYRQSLERCKENDVTDVGFSLLSAGLFRGRQSMNNILAIGVMGIRDWIKDADHCGALKTVTLCGFSKQEIVLLMKVTREVLGAEFFHAVESDIDEGGNHDWEKTPDLKRRRSVPSENTRVDNASDDLKLVAEIIAHDGTDATEAKTEESQTHMKQEPRIEMPKNTSTTPSEEKNDARK